MQRAWRRRWEKNKKYRQELLKKAAVPLVATGLIFSVMASVTYANPTGGNITTGQGNIHVNGSEMTIQQQTDKMGINWDSFSIGSGEKVKFIQPGSQSVALNRVLGSDASQIYGTLEANGRVFLINPNGVLFAQGANVNVGGLVATSSNISDADFIAGNYAFKGGQDGSIINGGNITATSGNVELLGSIVSNQGVITAAGISTDGSSGVVRLVGNAVDLAVGSSISADSSVLLRADVEATGIGTVTVAAGTVTAPKTTIYYNPASYNDSQTKTTVTSNPYKDLLPGTSVKAYMLVNTAADLQNINTNLAGVYALNKDLNLGVIDNFTPIGMNGWFTGEFDGEGRTIKNLTIDSAASNVGLFAKTKNASIHDLMLKNVDVTANAGGFNTYAGALVGQAVDSFIGNVTVSGSVEGNVDYVAGIVGRAQNTIVSNVHNSADVTTFDNSGRLRHTAGVVGQSVYTSVVENSSNRGIITNKNSEGSVGGLVTANGLGSVIRNSVNYGLIEGGASGAIGGIVATNWGETAAWTVSITGSTNFGAVIGGINSNIGGIAGSMKNSYMLDVVNEGSISGAGKYVGGLVGIDFENSWLENSTNNGIVKSTANESSIGGLIGYQRAGGTIINGLNSGAVTGAGNSNVAGFVGHQVGGTIDGGTNEGRVTSGSNSNTGGIVGYLVNGTLVNVTNTGTITELAGLSPASSDKKVRFDSRLEFNREGLRKNIGGIAGKSVNSSIGDAKNTGAVTTGNSFSNAGGIVGWANKTIVTNSGNTAFITSGDSSNVGGVAGYIANGTVLRNVYNTGVIGQTMNDDNGQLNSNVAGIVGWNYGSTIEKAVNSGNVNGGSAWHVGGVAGSNVYGTILDSSNSGDVTVFGSGSYVGGIAGANTNDSKIVNAYNSGAVTNHGYGAYSGGIAGTNWQNSSIDQSENIGSVTSTGTIANTGGIAGGNGRDPGGDAYIKTSHVTNSVNKGTVTGGSGKYSKTGGILGFNSGGIVENTINEGFVVDGGNSVKVGALVGEMTNVASQIVNSNSTAGLTLDVVGVHDSLGQIVNSTAASSATLIGAVEIWSSDIINDENSVLTIDIEV